MNAVLREVHSVYAFPLLQYASQRRKIVIVHSILGVAGIQEECPNGAYCFNPLLHVGGFVDRIDFMIDERGGKGGTQPAGSVTTGSASRCIVLVKAERSRFVICISIIPRIWN